MVFPGDLMYKTHNRQKKGVVEIKKSLKRTVKLKTLQSWSLNTQQ